MAISLEELLELPVAERFRLAEILWSSIPDTAGPHIVPLTAEHQREIDLAIAEYEADEHASVPYEEVMAELRNRLPTL